MTPAPAAVPFDARLDADGWPLFDDAPPQAPPVPERPRAAEPVRAPHTGGASEAPTEDIPSARAESLPGADDRSGGSAPADDGGRRRRRRRGRGRGRGRGEAPAERGGPGPAPSPREPRPEPGWPDEEPAGHEPAPSPFRAGAEPQPDELGSAHDDSSREPAAPRGESRAILHFFHPERLDACQRAIGYHFRDITLLENALTHSSIKSEDRPSYERLEFLGDSVVGLIVSEYIYNLLPDCDEGDLTKLKSMVVSTEGLANAAKHLGLDRFLAVGRGILMKEAVPRSLIADVFEGVAGAVYLDRGYESARLYVLDHLRPYIEESLSDKNQKNFKSVLQQIAQRDLGETPRYDLLREWGPEHSRQFEVIAVLGRRRFPPARAATKKEAEQAAARIALQTILVERGHGSAARRRRSHDGNSPR